MMELDAQALADLMVQYLEDHTQVYIISGYEDGDWKIEGTANLLAMARWMLPVLYPCPCDCEGTEKFTGRWTAGSFAGSGPLRSAYTCEEHSPLVRAWCERGTGLEPVWTGSAPENWRTLEVDK